MEEGIDTYVQNLKSNQFSNNLRPAFTARTKRHLCCYLRTYWHNQGIGMDALIYHRKCRLTVKADFDKKKTENYLTAKENLASFQYNISQQYN